MNPPEGARTTMSTAGVAVREPTHSPNSPSLPILSQEAQLTAGVTIEPGRAYGFFTDTTLCIGCKACEVACKEWNMLPADGPGWTGRSYDNTHDLSARTWRHVKFIEQFGDESGAHDGSSGNGARYGDDARYGDGARSFPGMAAVPSIEQWAVADNRWLLMSDVCKHCVNAPCLEACPTGAIIYTEYHTVYVQQDVCNGNGYCETACPFGVIQVDKAGDGKAHKCTLCYDRMKDGLEPACAKACPTDSIQFGPIDELHERAKARVKELRARGIPAHLYGVPGELETDCDTSALGGLNAFFLLIDDPEVYNLPAAPERPSDNTGIGLLGGALGALALSGAVWYSFSREAER